MKCKICGSDTYPAFDATVLGKYKSVYRKCNGCEYLCCEDPHWLPEAYSSPITSADTGLLARNIDLHRKIAVILEKEFNPSGAYLDYAGGYGVFTRLMRDAGFRFYHQDIYTQNLFANQFSWDGKTPVDGITCFECLEHLPDPLAEIRTLSRIAPLLIFSTTPLPCAIPDPSWDYYAFDHGQHISFYSSTTIRTLAEKVNMKSVSIDNIHIISRQNLNPARIRKLMKKANRISHVFSRRTLFEQIRRKRLKSQTV